MLQPEEIEAIADAVAQRLDDGETTRQVSLSNLVNGLDNERNRLMTVHNFMAFADSGRKYIIQVKEVERWPMSQ